MRSPAIEPLVDPDAAAAPAHSARAGTALSTFLITDIEGSTRLWEEHGDTMGVALAIHDGILRAAVEGCGGTVIKTTGDGLLAIFEDAFAGLTAALTAQRGLASSIWGPTGPLRVRMAIHAGAAESRDGDYFGPALNRSARILAIGHGGQILLSALAGALVNDRLPAASELRDLGSHRLRDLDRPEQVFQLVAPDLARDFPPLRSLSTRRSNLPVQLTSFVGREREVEKVGDLLTHHRLVTLIGTGGTGKTRLMLEAAGQLGSRYPDGTWIAELAALGDASQIPSEVARAVGAPEIPGVPAIATVSAFLADKDLLLLLDNAEHLVDGVARIAEQLLGTAPGLRIITTSREALAVAGEAVLQVQSLSCPTVAGAHRGAKTADGLDFDAANATEAVRLFAERAGSVAPGFAVDRDNLTAIVEICSRLDGIPLAIELAAARVASMSPDDIARRLGDRFRLLAGGRRTAVPRQQTLHALVDWSWDLLTEDDRRLLRRVSVFAGGWTIASAAAMVSDEPGEMDHLQLIDDLTRLVDRSLVIVERGATTRYRMLETIRQYAREKLVESGEASELADRHLAVFAALAADAGESLRGPDVVDALDRLDAELDNLSAALEWGLEAAPWTAVELSADLLGYWAVRVMTEDNDARIVAAVEIARARTIGRDDASPAELAVAAKLLGEAARLWAMSGRSAIALPWARDAIALAGSSGDVTAKVYALGGLALSTVFGGLAGPGGTDVRPIFEEAADLAERSGAWWVVALSAGFAGATIGAFDPDYGDAMVRRGIEAARRSGSPYAIGAASMTEGRSLSRLGKTDAAVAAYGVAIQRFMELGDDRFVLASRSDLAHALRRGGRLDEALALYRETIRAWVHLGHRGAVANQLENIAYVEIDRGNLDRAARLLGAAEGFREVAQAKMAFHEEPEFVSFVDQVRGGLTRDAFDAAWAAGRALTQAEAVAEAVVL